MAHKAFYNEIDPKAAAWLRQLIVAGMIAPGDVDERSIEDVKPSDLAGYTQVHFFAGIGVWSYALRQAGWPDSRPIWTGSCPCQPFSAAGKAGGFDDERHLWPAFHHLISQCRPDTVVGEQVASKDGLAWLDLVQADLEAAHYAAGAVDLCAAGVGAPHIRQRLYFAAVRLDDAVRERLEGYGRDECHFDESGRIVSGEVGSTAAAGAAHRLADTDVLEQRIAGNFRGEGCTWGTSGADVDGRSIVGGLANASGQRRQQVAGSPSCDEAEDGGEGRNGSETDGDHLAASDGEDGGPGPTNGFWRDADWLHCRDGKWRPVQPGIEQMADGTTRSLGLVLSRDISEIERKIDEWALRYQADAPQSLQALWGVLRASAVQGSTGGLYEVCSPAVLLSLMRQLATQGWKFSDSVPCQGSEESSRVLRVLRINQKSTCPPLRRELGKQRDNEPADPLCELSQILARFAEKVWGNACREKASTAAFPLALCGQNRVVRLKGYGNAINAEVAKAFIESLM